VGQKNRHVRNIGQTSRQSNIADKLAVGAEKQACQEYWANKQTKSGKADKQEGGAEKQACHEYWANKQTKSGTADKQEGGAEKQACQGGESDKQECPGRQDGQAGMSGHARKICRRVQASWEIMRTS
jgi:hypothetical protein